MKEFDFINTISKIIGNSYIGDDCAYLKDLGIVVSQDSLVEDIHFKTSFTTPFELGIKSVNVNVSDILASGAIPKYLTISLSLPKNVDNNWIEEFYNGAKSVAKSANIDIIGGDITGSENKIFISICAIGVCEGRNISSRSNAKPSYKVVVSGNFGSSATGLRLLNIKKSLPEKFIKSHLIPKLDYDFSKKIATEIKEPYAMMDSSDGLADALIKICEQSKVGMKIDFNKIPYDKDIEQFDDYKELILYGGEDYHLVACVPENFDIGLKIGEVVEGKYVEIDFGTQKKYIENKSFNHFG